MKRAYLVVLLAVVLLSPASRVGAAGTQHEGIIGPPPQVSGCLQGSHTLTDPCTGEEILLVSSKFSLDLFLGLHVRVSGPDVGVTCPVMDVRQIKQVVQKCSSQEP